MNNVIVDIIEDVSHPEGGHAIIRLKGLKTKPSSDAFMIEPAGISLSETDLKGWPSGARTPLQTRMTKTGFEIVVGPDVVESPVLLPGTPVSIKVPAAKVSAEVLWPHITPLRRAKIKRIITSVDRRDAMERMKTRNQTAQTEHRTAADNLANIVDHPARSSSPTKSSDSMRPSGPVRSSGLSGAMPTAGSDGLTTRPVARTPGKDMTAPLSNARSELSSFSSHKRQARAAASKTQPASRFGSTSTSRPQANELAKAISAKHPEAEITVVTHDPAPGDAKQPSDTRSSSNADANPVRSTKPMAKQSNSSENLAAKAIQPDITQQDPYDVFAPDDLSKQPEPPRSGRSSLTRLYAGMALLFAMVAAGVSLYSHFYGPRALDTTAVDEAVLQGQRAAAAPTLFNALKAEPISPRGVNVGSLPTTQMIDRAYSNLQAGDVHDTREGAFWLKQFLAKKFGDQQSLWALTQLGSTYARPDDGPPDYHRARLLWETAAALGDPVAACFLGGLHEQGLGVPVSRGAALRWYLLARQSGGCRSLDTLIARVSGS